MSANPVNEFDLGPLSWVKTEIDHSLGQARETLDKLAANPGEQASVKYVLTHLHQATGALAMVGLAAATRYNEELEKLVAYLDGEDATRMAGSVAVAKKGISAFSTYLDALLAGQADHPMRLLAPYLEVNRTRGGADANEGDQHDANHHQRGATTNPFRAHGRDPRWRTTISTTSHHLKNSTEETLLSSFSPATSRPGPRGQPTKRARR